MKGWAGTRVWQPPGSTGRFLLGSSTLQRGSLPTARPCLYLHAEVCQIACICKMWARRAGRRNLPLKRLIFKRNEARAGEQKQGARLVCFCHGWISEITSLPFEQTSRDLTVETIKKKMFITPTSLGITHPFPGLGDLCQQGKATRGMAQLGMARAAWDQIICREMRLGINICSKSHS